MRHRPTCSLSIFFTSQARWLRLGIGLLGCALCDPTLKAQARDIEPAAPLLSETGSPSFAIIAGETLGLTAPPTDIHLLPDGRLLVYGGRHFVLGDGTRWESFRQVPGEKPLLTEGVAIDAAGRIFMGAPSGFARVKFGADGFWRLAFEARWPDGEHANRPTLRAAVTVGEEWIWHSGSGSLIAWRPGQSARVAGQADRVETLFAFKQQIFLSDRNEARLYRLTTAAPELVSTRSSDSDNNAITCSEAYDENTLLVGTDGSGLQLFDGHALRPFLPHGLLATDLRINDLCRADGGLFAAAVENQGLVFFDHAGRIVQTLDRTLDHRLSHVRKLLAGPGGIIWALLDNGILRVQFPSRVSHFEPLVGTGVSTARPYRLAGKLWIMADGKTSRVLYDQNGRFSKLQTDTPAGRVFAFSTALGFPIAGTAHGAFYRNHSEWVEFAPATNNLRILSSEPIEGRWLYGAIGEIGWLRVIDGRVEIERISAPELNNIYNSDTDAQGVIWLELGTGRLGRIHFEAVQPKLEIFEARHGVPNAWAQIFVLDGSVGFNIADQILRFDDTTRRIVPDLEFASKYLGLRDVVGRPGIDPQGRLWITANGGVQVLTRKDGSWQNLHEKMPAGLRPYYFTFEKNGVVWMHSDRRLARFDPTMPVIAQAPVRALITHIHFNASNRTLFSPPAELPPLEFDDNALNVHFVAPGSAFAASVSFDVLLEGSGSSWVSAGGSSSAVFNRLKEGSYVLRVRPRSGETFGTEAVVAFVIRPPWFRSPLFYLLYTVGAGAAILLVGWGITFLQRRETRRLGELVARRTRELNQSNRLLATQVEEIQMLSEAIAQSPVGVIITKTDNTIVFANPRACEIAGLSSPELVGLNTRTLRSELITDDQVSAITAALKEGNSWHGHLAHRNRNGAVVHIRTTISPIRNPDGHIRLRLILEEDISEWIADQARRTRLESELSQSQKLESLGTLAGGIAHDFNNILTGILGYCELAAFNAPPGSELASFLQAIRTGGLRAKDLVAQILTFSRRGLTQLVPLDLHEPVSEALKLMRASTPATISLSSRLENGIVRADATQIQQIVLNLCTNAVHAMQGKTGLLHVTLEHFKVDERLAAEVTDLWVGPCFRLSVSDNGHGMNAPTLNRIFDPFFTTKPQGEGTGLGLSIVQGIVASHHGAVRVRSTPGIGSTFELYFPISDEPAPVIAPSGKIPRGAGQEILVVDDEPGVAAYVTLRLKQLGYLVTTFSDPRDALSNFLAAPTRFAAIVTDLTMPHLTGIDLIQRARAPGNDVPAVIITGYGRDAGGTRMELLPNCLVVYKPFGGDELARAVHQVLGGKLA